MNVFNGIGRLTKDVDLKYSQAGTAVARFSIAINRPFKNQNGEQEVDFINCIAFGKRAEVIAQYVKKGHRIGITGSVMTGSYNNKEGQRVYTTDINVSDFTFLESKQQSQKPTQQQAQQKMMPDAEPLDVSDDEFPF